MADRPLADPPDERPASAAAETLRALVAIDSVNPGYGGPRGGEARVIEWCAAFLRAHGVTCSLEEAFPGRPNLRARIEGAGPGPPLLFETHVDTVAAGGMSIAPFAAETREGKLWGRGATDAKAQVAALLHALVERAAAPEPPPRAIELALVVDEEFSFGGAAALAARAPEPAGIVIAEPTDLHIVTTHKGVRRWYIDVEGRAAHAAHPELGVNAIGHAARLVRAIEEDYAERLAARTAPRLGCGTINVGRIEGGVQYNLVPPSCRVYLEQRLLPGEDDAGVAAECQRLLDELHAAHPGFRAVQSPATLYAAAMQTDEDHPLVAAACAVAHEFGRPAEPEGVDFATDASELVGLGVPIIIIGPGHIAQAHTADEFVDLQDLALGIRFFHALMGRDWPAPE